jgi:hypothetical protein
MAQFAGQLRQNEIFNALFNMIISIEVSANNIGGLSDALVSKARVDGGLYGDTKLYIHTDALKSTEWGKDAEAANLLRVERPEEPYVQSLTMKTFRKIAVTVDNYLSKRAFFDEGSFSSFNGVILGWLTATKKIYDTTTYNAFIGCHETALNGQVITTADVASTEPATVDAAKLEGMKLAQKVADIIVELKDLNRINDLGYARAIDEDEIKVIWNSKYVNRISKVDLPTIFHNEGLVDKMSEDVLPAKYFGTLCPDGYSVKDGDRAAKEIELGGKHYFPGELIVDEGLGQNVSAGTVYTPDSKIICKIVGGKLPPYMSAFTTETSFFNPVALTESHWLIFGNNSEDLEHLYDRPYITLKTSA